MPVNKKIMKRHRDNMLSSLKVGMTKALKRLRWSWLVVVKKI